MVTLFDLVLVPVAYIYVFGVIYLASHWNRRGVIDGVLARKLVHIGIGILVILAPLLFSSNLVPTFIGLSFVVITYLTSPISPYHPWRLAAFREGHGFGTIYYSISLTTLLYLFFDQGWIIQIGFLPLVFGDAFANIVGSNYGRHYWFGLDKSIEGTIGGFFASAVVLMGSLFLYLALGQFPGTVGMVIILTLAGSLLMAVTELISPYGLDNLTIPLVCTGFALVYSRVMVMDLCVSTIC